MTRLGLWVAPQGREHLKLAITGRHLSTSEEALNQNTDNVDLSEGFGKDLTSGLCFFVLSFALRKVPIDISVSFDLLEIEKAGSVGVAASPQTIPLSFMDQAGTSSMGFFSFGKRGKSQRAPHLHASRCCLLKSPKSNAEKR